MTKKIVTIDRRAGKELKGFSVKVKLEFDALIYTLRNEGKLSLPEGKKISRNLFEIRVKVGSIYRGFYAYVGRNEIIILHFFQKKSQKTPIRNFEVAERRLREYER
jgi:phage-related protein